MKSTNTKPFLLLLSGASGCAALIYEIVWYQLLQLAIGSTAISLGILLATFMGGLCIGSLWLPRLRTKLHPFEIYARLEAGIAVCGVLVLVGLPLIDRVYIAGSQAGMPGMLLRGLICAICLLPPTILMGASLPAIVMWAESSADGASWWGMLYGANTAGAVFGCLWAGFYLLRIWDTHVATIAAFLINMAVAALATALAKRAPYVRRESPREVVSKQWTIYAAIAISGACALGGEVVWTRLMGMLLGATVYVFSIILAVFLIGIAIGSGLGSMAASSLKDARAARIAFGWCQVFLIGAIAWSVFMIADSLPYWPINPLLARNPWYTFQIDLMRTIWALLPPTLLWGASFPLALASVRGEDSASVVGGIYAANTFGSILGALVVSLALIPWIGTRDSQRVLLVMAIAGGVLVLAPFLKSKAVAAGFTAALVIGGILVAFVDPIPGEVIAYGRRVAIYAGQSKLIYTAEGRNSSVAITQWNDGAMEVDVNGHVEATTEPYDMKLQRMVGHLPALLHANPKSVLGIGFGAGVSAGTFTRYPGIEHITVCEIEPVIPPTSTRFFAREDYDVLHNPKTRIVYDDARHFVLTTPEKFDIIASDPLDVFVKGTAALYSREYFEAVKAHLNPGGYFTLYVPLYESDEKTVKSELATFFAAFPNATIWVNTRSGQGYDMVFMGQTEPLKINLDEVRDRLARPDYAPVAESLWEIGVHSAIDLLSAYTAQKSDLDPWLEGAEINHDRDLRLQYLAGWGINASLEDYMYRQMLGYRHSPANVFTGSPDQMAMLMNALSIPPAGQ
ncbi:MAG TPA: fused MFS/spermidine synthase [Bryobacteraceae bacterium]|nr:fused MFS/spermidine synthase [Bryobacteraceae bacterium]